MAAASSPFEHFHSVFNADEVVRRYEDPDRRQVPGHFVNFFGVATPGEVLPEAVSDLVGQVESSPLPSNWHADTAEFAAALRAVDLASSDAFTMIELGCGWGCWMNITAAAAKRRGVSRIRVIGIEGDERHVRLAKETCERNGLSSAEYTIHRGIAAAVAGVALFPKTEVGAWGHEPIIRPSWRERRRYLATGHYDELPLVPLSRAAADHARIDLLHVDIQGGEADLVDGALNFLGERVAYLVIGSHSREIEGRLFATLLRAGWKLEVERPAILSRESERPIVLVDGVQGWRNPKLSPG